MEPPWVDLASQITPTLTPEACHSDKWFNSYNTFKIFFQFWKIFFIFHKILKIDITFEPFDRIRCFWCQTGGNWGCQIQLWGSQNRQTCQSMTYGIQLVSVQILNFDPIKLEIFWKFKKSSSSYHKRVRKKYRRKFSFDMTPWWASLLHILNSLLI